MDRIQLWADVLEFQLIAMPYIILSVIPEVVNSVRILPLQLLSKTEQLLWDVTLMS